MDKTAFNQDRAPTAVPTGRIAAEPITAFALLHLVLLLGVVGTTAMALLKSLLHTV